MASIYDKREMMDKIARGEELSKDEKKEFEDTLCQDSDDFFGCAVDVRDAIIRLERKREAPTRQEVTEEIHQVLEDYGALTTVEEPEEEPETIEQPQVEEEDQVEEEEPEEEEEEAPTEDIQAIIEGNIFNVLQEEDRPLSMDALNRAIPGYDRDNIERIAYELLAEELLTQTLQSGNLVYYPSQWEEEEEVQTIKIDINTLSEGDAEWLDEHDEYVVEVDEIEGEVFLTQEGYEEFTGVRNGGGEEQMQEQALEAMKEISSEPGFVEEIWTRKNKGEISDDEFEYMLRQELGDDEFRQIREQAIEVIRRFED